MPDQTLYRTYNTARNHRQHQSSEPTAVAADRAKHQRARFLRYALPAMRAMWNAGVDRASHPACVNFYTLASVELTYLSGKLGETDHDRIDEIAEFFGVDRCQPDFLWFVAATELEAQHGKCHEAASKALMGGDLAVIAHRPLFDMADASKAFHKTAERDKALFAPKLIEPYQIDPKTGRGAKTKRIYTGMPNYHPGIVVRVLDGPGTDRFTTTERKAMGRELGVTTETVRTYERDKTEAEFDAWRERRRKIMANRAEKALKVAEKAVGLPKRKRWQRERKPGKTAAVLAFSRRKRVHISHAWRLCKGLTAAQLEAQLAGSDIAYIGGYDPRPARDESDKSAENPAFLKDGLECVSLPHESKDESDKSAENPAFSHNLTPDPVANALTPGGVKSEIGIPSTDIIDTLNAWERLRAIPDPILAVRDVPAISYVPFPYPTADQHAETMSALRAGADQAWHEYGLVMGL